MNISIRQATLILILFQIGSSFLVLPSELTRMAKQDAWISVLVSLGLFMLIIPLYIGIANQLQGKSLGQHLSVILGKWAGNMVLIVFVCCVPLLIFILTLRNLSDYLTTSIMPETPIEIIYVMMLFPIYFVVRAGIRVLGRSAELLFFVIPLIYVIYVLSLLPSMKLNYLLPIFEHGLKPIVLASLPLLSFPYSECVIFLLLVPSMSEVHKWKKALIWSTGISGSMYFIMIVITISVLSEGVTSNLTYPSYFVTRTINIADFIQRFEVVVAVFWLIAIFVRLSLLLFVSIHALAEAFRIQDANCLIIPLQLIAFAMSYTVWPNVTAAKEYIHVYQWYAMVFGIIGPAMIWLVGKWRSSTKS